ncbi:hypothetical protein ACFQGT_03725 [Natrialbaceae archaeon GCM10025810]|uniref:hypothetical protein n=1 Tax=Halovalidus salilacus TaxID=3075124 RepID=UPI00360D46D3
MEPREPEVDPTDVCVLERNYDYAQKNLWVLSLWYECDVRTLVELLAKHEIPLSANDERQFGSYYRSVQRRVNG